MGKRLAVKYQNNLLSELSPEIPENGIITIGNDASATIELRDKAIAPEQFVLVCEPEQIILMCRVDGTFINGNSVPQGTIHNFQETDIVTVGNYNFSLRSDEKTESEPVETSIPPNPEIHESKSERTLTDVLQSLRAEEKFYFQIGENQRLFIEAEEAFLGKNSEGIIVLTAEESEIQTPSLQIRKDWSGVVAYPLTNTKVWLGNKILSEPHRLKNDEMLFLQVAAGSNPNTDNPIRFHEPTALLVLDSILPKDLPPPVSLDEAENLIESEEEETDIQTSQIPPKASKKRLFFGYFTLIEVLIMIIGTLITAAIIFLVLEFY